MPLQLAVPVPKRMKRLPGSLAPDGHFHVRSTQLTDEIDAEQLTELRQAFECFDKDKSGSIDKAELREVMASLGQCLDDAQLEILAAEMDPSGDGAVQFDEFAAVMAREPGEGQDPHEVAGAIFKLLDRDGSGSVKTSELRAGLEMIGAGLSDDDLAQVLDLFDSNRSGDISKHEFVQALEAMQTFSK